VQVVISRNTQNRSLLIIADSAQFYRRSEVPLDGEGAPRTTVAQCRGLPGGNYSVLGELRDGGGRTVAVVREEVRVVSLANGR
jgi:hypothetical protein